MPNPFEALLSAITDPNDAESLKGLATKYPSINDYIAPPDQVNLYRKVDAWSAQNWDDEHKMTKTEWRQQQQIAEMTRLIAEAPGDSMELNELNTWLDQQTKDGKVLTAAGLAEKVKPILDETFTAKEKGYQEFFSGMLNTQARIATRIPYLNAKHQQEYGTMFDPDEFLTKAVEAKATSLDEYYKTYTAEAAEAKRKADIDKQIADARADERKKALQETAMGERGQMPTSEGGPEMGHFEAKIRGLGVVKDKSPVPEGAELGRNQISAAMARAGDRAEIEGRVA